MAEEKKFYSNFNSVLVARGVLTAEQLEEAVQEAGRTPLDRYLMESGKVDSGKLLLAEAEYVGHEPLQLPKNFATPLALIDLATPDFWKRNKALPLQKCGDALVVAFGDPFDMMAPENVARTVKLEVLPLVAIEKEVNDALTRAEQQRNSQNPALAMENVMHSPETELELSKGSDAEESLDQSIQSADEAPVIRMVNMMLVEALRTGASDIHFEAMEKTSRLRYRIDGALIERPAPPKALHNAIVSRIKIMSDLDIAERRVPQDGRFKVKAMGKEVDIRVSILPTIHGEKVVMRTLDKTNLAPSLAALGLDDFAYRAMKHAIDQPHGIILVTGPTGSGKTTTLYSCLQDLNQPDVNIVTAEDPVEYQLPGVNQVAVNQQVGLTFASVLRSVLRQDPDICLVGEIRDGETADIAVKAALTGHLVLSTLHTNDAPGVIARLIDMGIPPFLLASSLILAQAGTFDAQMLEANEIDPHAFDGATIYDAVGCPKCNGSGYKGRGAIMEVLPVSDDVRTAIVKGLPSDAIRKIAVKEGMMTLKDVGLLKVRDGLTSLKAALAVTGSE